MELQKRLLEGSLDLPHPVATTTGVLLGVGGIHDVENGVLVIRDIFLGEIGPSVQDRDGCLHVVEIPAEELEEFY